MSATEKNRKQYCLDSKNANNRLKECKLLEVILLLTNTCFFSWFFCFRVSHN